MTVDIRTTLAEAGFPVPDVPSWAAFVSGGELGRVLSRSCALLAPRYDVSYVLRARNAELVLDLDVAGAARSIVIVQPEPTAWPKQALCGVLRAINEALLDHGLIEQLVLVELSGRLQHRQRVVLLEPGLLATVKAGDYAADCVPDRAARDAVSTAPAFAALPPLDTRAPERFPEDGSLLGLIAAYIERLAAFAGADHITCKPRWVQDPGVMTFTFDQSPPRGGGLSMTLRLPGGPELDTQTILDTINGRLDRDAPRLYRIARAYARADVVRLTKTEAAALRRSGDLIERPAGETLRALENAGFELPTLSGDWRMWTFHVGETLRRFALLARDIASIDTDVERNDAGLAVTWSVDGSRTTTRYSAELDEHPTTEVLGDVIGDLNRALAAAGHAHRAVVMTGMPVFYGHRAVLLDAAWLARVARTGTVLTGCLDPAMLARIDHVLAMHPLAEPESVLPRLPRMDEIVDRAEIRGHDFKCSARPSDFVTLIEELAELARLVVEVGGIRDHGEEVAIAVSYRGASGEIRLDNEKYVNPIPILTYLNAILDGHRPRRQLYLFRGGGWDRGVVRATDQEAERLRDAGYIA